MTQKMIIDFFSKSWYAWLLLFAAVLYRILYPDKQTPGEVGEAKVARILASLSRRKYKVIHNIMLKQNSRTTQIDHVVVSRYGIFVIETKNYKGIIFGSENSNQWTQVLYHKKYHFYNPIRQNKSHVTALKRKLKEYPKIPFYSIVTFSENSKLQVESTTPVVPFRKLKKTILSHRKSVLTQNEVRAITRKIKSENIDSRRNRKKHVKYVKKVQAIAQRKR